MNTSDQLPKDSSVAITEWKRLIASAPLSVCRNVATIVKRHAEACVSQFYDVLLNYPDATLYLSHEVVDVRLRAALERWLAELFSPMPPDVHSLVATQRQIGSAHARIQIPIHVVMHGARLLKGELRFRLQALGLPASLCFQTIAYAEDMIDIAIEFMSQAFVQDSRKEVEKNEAFRLMSLGQDISLERETQRSALLEWGQSLLFDVCYGGRVTGGLADSEFGLWLRHKGHVLFQGTPQIKTVDERVECVDHDLVPALISSVPPLPSAIKALQGTLDEIRYLMEQLFKTAEALEGGRDPLTKTLSRRFLPTILTREVSMSLRRDMPFSVLMVDIDHFKAINDKLGHIGGDVVLRNVADVLVRACRVSDFIFRYGGEEFLVLLIETPPQQALLVAERIRVAIEEHSTLGTADHNMQVTASIGVASFDGHPDHSHLIEAADRALYLAKANGRNRCHLA